MCIYGYVFVYIYIQREVGFASHELATLAGVVYNMFVL